MMGSIGGGSPEEKPTAGGDPPAVCVTGSTGYIGSWLVGTLLRRGYRVHATTRDTGKARQVLGAVEEGRDRLRVFRADMSEDGSFDDAVRGCVALFHVAASMEIYVPQGQNNVALTATCLLSMTPCDCRGAREVKCAGAGDEGNHQRAAVLRPRENRSPSRLHVLHQHDDCGGRGGAAYGDRRRVVPQSARRCLAHQACRLGQRLLFTSLSCSLHDTSHMRHVQHTILSSLALTCASFWQIYILSKRLTEEAAFEFAREKGVHLVSLVIPTVAGPFLTPSVPTSIQLLLSPITGDPKLYSLLASVHSRFGCLPLSHIQDVCDAHVFLMETPRAEGRYLCAGGSHAMAQIAQFLASHYRPFEPAERLSKDFDASCSSVVSSKRLLNLGFKFTYGVGEIVKESVARCVEHGFLECPP